MAEDTGRLLTAEERRNALWLKIKAHMEQRIALLRARNDRNVDAAKTAAMRGAIGELKYLVSLGDEQLVEPPENELFKD